jgi:hypothetical protein
MASAYSERDGRRNAAKTRISRASTSQRRPSPERSPVWVMTPGRGDLKTGALLFEVDGSGEVFEARQFATLKAGLPALSADDFTVI